MYKRKLILQFLPVLFIVLLAMYCRYRFNFFQNTITGDGAYYPLQVRSVLEHFRLALPDMPIYYYFTAFIAQIIIWITNISANESIILAVKLVDVILPTMSGIIVFLFAKQLISKNGKLKFTHYLMIAFSLLSLPYIVYVSGELQKTAIGIALIFLYLLLIFKYLEKEKKQPIKIAIFLVIAASTHFGSFIIIILFTAILFIYHIKEIKSWYKKLNTKVAFAILSCIPIAIISIYIFDTARFHRLISIPFQIFDAPVITFWIKGMQPFNPVLNTFIIVMNLLSVIAILVIIKRKKDITVTLRRFVLSLIILAIILSSPLLNVELSWRLNIFSFIPVTIIYLILFDIINSKLLKTFLITIFLIIILYSVRTGFVGHRQPTISKDAYIELQTIKENITLKDNSVVVTRLFLGWWVSWELRTNVSQDYAITQSDLEKYNAIYYLKETNNNKSFDNNLLDAGVDIPLTAISIYKGENYEIFELPHLNNFKILPHKTPCVIGKITNLTESSFSISNGKLVYIVKYKQLNKFDLKGGDMVKVWGCFSAFSNIIKADKIVKYEAN